MSKKKLPKGLRRYIRKEKARIRREILDIDEQKKKIEELYKNLFKPAVSEKQSEKTAKKEKTTKKKETKSSLDAKDGGTSAKVIVSKVKDGEDKKKNKKKIIQKERIKK